MKKAHARLRSRSSLLFAFASLPALTLASSCAGSQRAAVRTADDVTVEACLEAERRIVASAPTSRAEDEAKLAGVRLACDIVREHLERANDEIDE